MLDGSAESASDWFLAGNFVKGLGTPFPSDYLIGHGYFLEIGSELARPRTFPQHTLPLLPLLRSRPGGVHKASVVRSPGSDKWCLVICWLARKVVQHTLLCATSVFSVPLWLKIAQENQPQSHIERRGCTEKSDFAGKAALTFCAFCASCG